MKSHLSKMPIFIALALLFFATTFLSPAKAQIADVSPVPTTVEIANIGESATVDINITDVADCFAWEMKIYWLKQIVNVTAVLPAGHFLEPVTPGNLFTAKWLITQNFNDTHGEAWLGVTLLSPESPRSGSGVLVRLTVGGLSEGPTPMVLSNYTPTSPYPTKLSNSTAQPIENTTTDAMLTVIPEFPIALLLPVLAMVSLVAVSFSKLYHKRRY